MIFEVVVYGKPQPAGSKKGFSRKNSTFTQIVDANPKAKDYKASVSQAAGEKMQAKGLPIFEGPLFVELRFYLVRPKGHWNSKGELNAAGRRKLMPTSKPDVLKLARGVEDALSGVVYRDDNQIVREVLSKTYGSPTRVEIIVRPFFVTDAAENAQHDLLS